MPPRAGSATAHTEGTPQPSRQGASKRWTRTEEEELVRLLAERPDWQNDLLPGHAKGRVRDSNSGQGKLFVCNEIAQTIWPGVQHMAERVRSKVSAMHAKYREIVEVMGETGQGLFLANMIPGSPLEKDRLALLKKTHWFETFHRMMRMSGPDRVASRASERVANRESGVDRE